MGICKFYLLCPYDFCCYTVILNMFMIFECISHDFWYGPWFSEALKLAQDNSKFKYAVYTERYFSQISTIWVSKDVCGVTEGEQKKSPYEPLPAWEIYKYSENTLSLLLICHISDYISL